MPHRFRLWRIDARRVQIEGGIARMFGPDARVADIAARVPSPTRVDNVSVAQIDAITDDLNALAQRCRRQSLSMMVPMGQELAYRL